MFGGRFLPVLLVLVALPSVCTKDLRDRWMRHGEINSMKTSQQICLISVCGRDRERQRGRNKGLESSLLCVYNYPSFSGPPSSQLPCFAEA